MAFIKLFLGECVMCEFYFTENVKEALRAMLDDESFKALSVRANKGYFEFIADYANDDLVALRIECKGDLGEYAYRFVGCQKEAYNLILALNGNTEIELDNNKLIINNHKLTLSFDVASDLIVGFKYTKENDFIPINATKSILDFSNATKNVNVSIDKDNVIAYDNSGSFVKCKNALKAEPINIKLYHNRSEAINAILSNFNADMLGNYVAGDRIAFLAKYEFSIIAFSKFENTDNSFNNISKDFVECDDVYLIDFIKYASKTMAYIEISAQQDKTLNVKVNRAIYKAELKSAFEYAGEIDSQKISNYFKHYDIAHNLVIANRGIYLVNDNRFWKIS